MRFKFLIVIALSLVIGGIVLFDQPAIERLGDDGSKRWKYSFSNGEVELDRATGQILRWVVDERIFVDFKNVSENPIALRPARGDTAHFSAASHTEIRRENDFEIVVTGTLQFAKGGTPAALRYRIQDGARKISVAFSATAPVLGDDLLKEWKWTLPLSLAPRKRVYFKGEHGLDFETRYFYQFTSKGGQLLNPADRNEWRWFTLDQLGENAFRLWKSESESTAPLVMQEGVKMPSYVQLRNVDRGVSVEAPSLGLARGRSLQVDASDGGRVIFYAWSPSFEGLRGASATRLFDDSHELILTADTSEAALLKTREDLNVRYPSSALPEADELLKEPQWVQSAKLRPQQYLSGGYPFAQGQLRDVRQIQLKVGGGVEPFQADPLGYWPDGSLKWVLLTFQVDPAMGRDSCPAPYVSLRNGKFLPVEVTVASSPQVMSPRAGSSGEFIARAVAGGGVTVKNGDLVVQLEKGTQWVNATLNGEPVIQPAAGVRLGYLDVLRKPTTAFPFHYELPGGSKETASLRIDSVDVEVSGPMMKVIKLTGMMEGEEKMPVSLRVKMYAGVPEMELSYATEFSFDDPRQTFLSGLGIQLPVRRFDLSRVRFGEAPPAGSGVPSGLVQESRTSRWVRGPQGESLKEGGATGWIEAEGEGGRFIGVIRNFAQTAPKAITIGAEGTVRFELWPSAGPAMDLRRYSNYPHLGQGEAVPTDIDWVSRDYYPNDPVAGISRTHELLFSFQPAGSGVSPEMLAADYQSPPLLYAGAEVYTASGVQLATPGQNAWPRARKAWENLTRFWLYHRGLYGWDGFWSYGDFRHRFRDGYGWILPAEVTMQALKGEASQEVLEKHEIADAIQSQDWSFDNGRWGWTNTEGIPNFFLQNEYLRNGDRIVYFAAEAMARFSRDVVIRQSGKWFGAGTRHGVQHWSDGSHEERQTTPAEYRIHYFLSGDGRTRDVVEKLYAGHFNQATLWDPADHGGRLSGLFFHAELTGDPAHFEQLGRYAHTFLDQGKLSIGPTVPFPAVIVKARKEAPDEMFFHYYGGWHALLEYQQITADPALKAAIIKLADATLASPEMLQGYKDRLLKYSLSYSAVAFAALHSADPSPYQQFLRETLQGEGWGRLYQPVTGNPLHWSGSTAFLRDNSPGCFFWANWAPYICAALGTDTVWEPRMEQEISRIEGEGMPSKPSEGRWQAEFDEYLELREYLDSQKPWLVQP